MRSRWVLPCFLAALLLGNIQAWAESPASSPTTSQQHADDPRTQIPVLMELGVAYAESQRWQPAIERFQQVLTLNASYAPAHYGLGRVYYEQQRYAEAEAELLLAIRLNPQYTDAYAALAFVNEAVGDRVGAVASLEKAVALLRARGTAAGQTSQGPPLTKEERTLLKRLEKGLEKLGPAASAGGKGDR